MEYGRINITVKVVLTPTMLVMDPAKNPTIAKHPYNAPLAASVSATLELMDPPAPKPKSALNMPGQHKHTKPSKVTCVKGRWNIQLQQ